MNSPKSCGRFFSLALYGTVERVVVTLSMVVKSRETPRIALRQRLEFQVVGFIPALKLNEPT